MRPRSVMLAAVALAATACGGNVSAPTAGNMPAASAPRAIDGAPPDAYIEFGHPGRWMVQGSSCWTSGNSSRCADAVAVEMMKGLPLSVVKSGSTGRIHLGFTPTKMELTIGKRHVEATLGRTITFKVTRGGIVDLFVNHGSDDAQYFARVDVSH